MKKIISALVVLVAFASCQEQQKIAFVDNGKVINDYQMKIDIESKFKLQDDAFKKRVDSISKAFQAEAQSMSVQAQKMSQAKQQELYQSFTQRQQGLQQQFQYEQQQMQQLFNQEMDSVIVKVQDFIGDYGKNNGYTYILGKNEAGSVMFGKEENDISEEITKKLNDSYKDGDTEKETAKDSEEAAK